MPSANAIRAGRAFVELFTDDKALVRGLNAAKAKLNSFGAAVAKIGAGLTTAGLAIAGPLLGAAKSFSDTGDAIAKMSRRTGIAVESLSQLAFATSQSGTSLEALEKGVRKMQRTIIDAATGSTEAAEAIGLLGLNLDDIRQLSPEDQFFAFADALAGVENPTTRAALAMEIFGRSGAELIPLMAGGAAGIRALKEQADALGLTLSSEDAAAAEVFTDAMDQVVRVIKRTVVAIGAALAPALTNLANLFNIQNVSLGQWIDQNREVIRIVAGVAAATVAAGAAITALGIAIKVVAAGFGLAATAIAATTAVVGALATPIGAITAALVAGIAAWLTYSQTGQAAVAALSEVFGQVRDDVAATITGIVDALAAGDLKLAAEVAMAGVQVAFLTAKNALLGAWIELRNTMEGAWLEVGAAIIRIWNTVVNALVRITAQVGTAIQGFFENAAADALAFLGVISEAEAEAAKADLEQRRAAELGRVESGIDARRELEASLDDALNRAARARAEGTAKEIEAAEAALEEARRKLIDATQRASAARARAGGAEPRNVDVQIHDLDDIEARLSDVAGQMADAQDQIPEAMAIGSQAAAEHILRSFAAPNAELDLAKQQLAQSKEATAFLKRINDVLRNAPLLAASTI